jgi:hypothetical protein
MEKEDTGPEDKGRAVFLIMFYLGLGQLLPWNAFITASGYFEQRFCNSRYENDFENWFSLAFTLSQTIGLALAVIYQNYFTLQFKITVPLIAYSVIFLINTILVLISISAGHLFAITMIGSLLCGVCGSVLSSGLFGLAAIFPTTYTGAVMYGQALAGLLISLASLFTTLAGNDKTVCKATTETNDEVVGCITSTNFSAMSYFLIATLVLVSCSLLFGILNKLEFTKYYIDRAGANNPDEICYSLINNDEADVRISSPEEDESLRFSERETISVFTTSGSSKSMNKTSNVAYNVVHGEGRSNTLNSDVDSDVEAMLASKKTSNATSVSVLGKVFYPCIETIKGILFFGKRKLSFSDNSSSPKINANSSFSTISRVFRIVLIPALSVFFVFVVSLAIFPSLIVLIVSEKKCTDSGRFYNDLFIPFLFVMFNLFDLIGRISAAYYSACFTPTNVWMGALSRLIFFPLFLLCNISGSNNHVLFKYDIFPISFTILLAFTNGYFSNLSMMFGPSLTNPTDGSLAGTIMIFMLTAGLLAGSLLSFLVVFIAH